MKYRDMEIVTREARLETTADDKRVVRFRVHVHKAPNRAMNPDEAIQVEFDYDELEGQLSRLAARELDRDGLIRLGRTLALLLFPAGKDENRSIVRDILAENLNSPGRDWGLRLRLQFPPLLAALPWEYAYVDRAGGGDGMDGFLALDPSVAIVRQQPEATWKEIEALEGDIILIAALAAPAGAPRLDVKKERSYLEEAFAGNPGIRAIFLDKATLDQIVDNLPGAGVFHFAGHGSFSQQMGDALGSYTGTGSLILTDQSLSAEQMGMNLGRGTIRLAVLGGCETGRRDETYVWTGIAPSLIKHGIPAVVANQFRIKDKSAVAFSRRFYRALAGGLPIEQAVVYARMAINDSDPDGRDWGVPVLYLNSTEGRLFSGAADPDVRAQARAQAEANVNVYVAAVAAGGSVLGAKVAEMLDGKVAVQVVVAGDVYGTVVGAKIKDLEGGSASVTTRAGTVQGGASLIGAEIDRLGKGGQLRANTDVDKVEKDGKVTGIEIDDL